MATRSGLIGRDMILILAAALFTGGCAASAYHLPPPPTPKEQAAAKKQAAAAKGSQVASNAQLNQRARASLLKLYELLSKSQFEEAEGYLSQETRDFLSASSQTNDPSAALDSSEFRLPDGRILAIDPVKLLIGGNIVRIKDALQEADEGETANRRVLYVFDPQGKSHRVIMISEGGKWVLHATSINPKSATTPAQ